MLSISDHLGAMLELGGDLGLAGRRGSCFLRASTTFDPRAFYSNL